jgi:RNase P protein component
VKKICKGCELEKEIEEFNYKSKEKLTRQSQCKTCTRSQVRKHYYARHDYYLKKAQKRNKVIREKIKKYICEYLQKHPCIDCGEKDIVVLTFDHIRDKLFNISETARWRFGLITVKEEIKKCEVRCANCHLRKTAKQFKWKKMVS